MTGVIARKLCERGSWGQNQTVRDPSWSLAVGSCCCRAFCAEADSYVQPRSDSDGHGLQAGES